MNEKERAAIEPQQEAVATVVARQYDDGTYAGNALDWAGRSCEDDFPVGTKLYTAPPQQKAVAWMYKAEPWFDGDYWHETYETTTDKTLAYFKDKNARALCFVEK